MRTGISISLNSSDRTRLAEIAADRNSPQKHVWRAQIVLLSAQGVGANEIMRATRKAKSPSTIMLSFDRAFAPSV